MIQTLLIQNLVLVDRARIHFGPGLNIITGETGSGKSALLSAIRLILGERADLSLLRHGADLAIIEANLPHCTVRREIHRSGKSRAFINDELVSLQELKNHLSSTIQIIDQGSAFALAEPELQQKILDDYAGSAPLLLELQQHKTKLREQQLLLAQLLNQKETNHLPYLEQELSLIEEINWQPNEEEALTSEHHLLTHAQEIQERIGSILSILTDGNQPVLTLLKRLAKEKLPPEPQALLTSGVTEIEEAIHLLTTYLSTVEASPERLLWIESRIGQIESLKRRLRISNYSAYQAKKTELQNQINQAETLDIRIQEIRSQIQQTEQQLAHTTNTLRAFRKQAAPRLIETVLSELRSLNLPDAALDIDIQDSVAFHFSANKGHPPLPLNQVASGGELSRLLFALKTVLSSSAPSCLIFDEIDSNVGGTTASLLGQKLQTLSQNRQLICITHFVQVAKHALHHFRVTKATEKNSTYTQIEPLSTAEEREQEYTRMLGLDRKRTNSLT